MNRSIESQVLAVLVIEGDLVAQGPLHVGGLGGADEVDLALARDGRGELYVPGTSLAGPLRAWIVERVGAEAAGGWWGSERQERGGAEQEGAASQVIVADATVQLPEGASVEIRDGVGIDRTTGASASDENLKFDRAVIPRGSRLKFRLSLEQTRATPAAAKAVLGALVSALEDGEIRLGAARTRGLGWVRLDHPTIREQRLDSPAGLLETLRTRGRKLGPNELGVATEMAPQPRLAIEIGWKPAGPLMVKSEHEGVGVDHLPLTGFVGSKVAALLPGSSIKGALRAHAERLVRTAAGLPVHERTSRAMQVPVVEELFGSTGLGADGQARETPHGLGALVVQDCYATLNMDRAAWRKVEESQDEAGLRQALDAAGARSMQQAFHVAVDRWTGGASDGALYSVLEPHGAEWEPLRLWVDLSRLARFGEGAAEASVALLLLSLRDLAAGRIPLGYGTNRGMGALQVSSIRIRGRDLPAPLAFLADTTLAGGRLDEVNQGLTQLGPAWRRALGVEVA